MNKTNSFLCKSTVALGLVFQMFFIPVNGWAKNDEPSAAEITQTTITETGQKTAEGVSAAVQRFEENRMSNRSRDEIVAWVVVGLFVGTLAGSLTKLNCSGLGKLGRIALGLAGAYIGSMFLRVANLSFEWGGITVRYDEVLFSILGAILLVVMGRFIRHYSKKKPVK